MPAQRRQTPICMDESGMTTEEASQKKSLTTTSESAEKEYSELGQWLRFHSQLRFATLTIFAALSGAIVTVVFKTTPALSNSLQTVLKIAGALTAIVFLAMEVSSAMSWRRFAKRGVAIEQNLLPFELYKTMFGAPKFRWLPTTFMVWLLYLSALAFWLLTLLWPTLFS